MDDEAIDALRSFLETRLEEVNFCLPGTVQSYDGRLAVVTPDLPKQIADGRVLAPPAIHNVVVRWFAADVLGNVARITGPLKKGDGGMLVFSQRSIDDWISGSVKAPLDPRMFDLNDAFFIPGVNRGSTVAAADTENLSVTYGTGGFKIAPSGITTFLGPVVFEEIVTMQAASTFEAPVLMTPEAPLNATGGITGQDGFTFERHTHDVVDVEPGSATIQTTIPNT
jgi:hypothetical protein